MRFTSLAFVALAPLAACSSSADTHDTTSTGGSGGAASTTTSSSSTSSSSSSGMPAGQPITAPAEQWTWIPFDDAFCANGSTTGIGVNLTTKSSRVIIYLEGGGACWDATTCYTLGTASNITSGYGEADFKGEAASTSYLAEQGGFFDRSDATNPLKDYSYVYVPYCTGDIHAGNNVADYGGKMTKHVGFKNMSAYLARVVPTFPAAERVVIAGSSAGGLGAAYNWWQTQQAFGSVRVDLIDDSGTPMPTDVPAHGYEPTQRTNWGLEGTIPPGCTACKQNLDALLPFYAQQFPTHRGALLSYVQDSVLPTFYGISTMQFEQGLTEETTQKFDPSPNLRYFLVGSSGHVLWFDPSLTTKSLTLKQFVTQMLSDDPAWASVAP